MTKQGHIHKLKRHVYDTGNKIYFCVLDDCNYKVDCAMSLGKTNICHRCGNPFKMNEVSIRLAKPHCPNCSKKKVTDKDGNTRFINSNQVMNEIAADSSSNLTSRLDEIVKKAESEASEDI